MIEIVLLSVGELFTGSINLFCYYRNLKDKRNCLGKSLFEIQANYLFIFWKCEFYRVFFYNKFNVDMYKF